MGDRKSDGHNVQLAKTQDDLAKELEISKKQMSRFKSLTNLIPELQDAVQSGQITATTAMGFVKKLSPEEQAQLAEQISGKNKVSGSEVQEYINQIKEAQEENQKLRTILHNPAARYIVHLSGHCLDMDGVAFCYSILDGCNIMLLPCDGVIFRSPISCFVDRHARLYTKLKAVRGILV